jgi:hypothetical protein
MAEPDVARFDALLTSPARAAETDRKADGMGSVNELNKMQLDSEAHRMPQAPLSRSPRNGPADERRVSSGTGMAKHPLGGLGVAAS